MINLCVLYANNRHTWFAKYTQKKVKTNKKKKLINKKYEGQAINLRHIKEQN